MNTKTAVKRAKDFLNHHIGEMYDWDIDVEEGDNDYDFSYANQPFYVYLDSENRGCFGSEGSFRTEDQVNEIISAQMGSDHREHWDNVIIFDVEQNKVVVPKIGL